MAPTARGDVSRRPPVDPDLDAGPASAPSDRGRRPRSGRNRAVVLALACGGAAGAVTRDAVSLAMPAAAGQFPWGTFAINVTGSFVLGFLLILVLEQFPRGRLARPILGAGFLGAFTTFSTFMVDAVQLVHDGRPTTAVAYVLASLFAGLLAVWLGMGSARVAIRAERWVQETDR